MELKELLEEYKATVRPSVWSYYRHPLNGLLEYASRPENTDRTLIDNAEGYLSSLHSIGSRYIPALNSFLRFCDANCVSIPNTTSSEDKKLMNAYDKISSLEETDTLAWTALSFALFFGFARKDFLSLRPNDIDLTHGLITIHRDTGDFSIAEDSTRLKLAAEMLSRIKLPVNPHTLRAHLKNCSQIGTMKNMREVWKNYRLYTGISSGELAIRLNYHDITSYSELPISLRPSFPLAAVFPKKWRNK